MDNTECPADLGSRRGAPPRRGRVPRRLTVAAVAAALTLVTAACGGGDDDGAGSTPSAGPSSAALGPAQPASGAPVKVGVISDGKSAAIDNTIQLVAADAVSKFLNDHRGGIGGRPIELVTCETHADPAVAGDCANRLIQAGVVVTVLGELSSLANVWQSLHDAGIPMAIYGTTETAALLDKDRTFVMVSASAGLADLPISVAKEKNLSKVT